MFTPADTAALQRFRPMLAQAMSSATREELHAVSEVTLGPHGSPAEGKGPGTFRAASCLSGNLFYGGFKGTAKGQPPFGGSPKKDTVMSWSPSQKEIHRVPLSDWYNVQSTLFAHRPALRINSLNVLDRSILVPKNRKLPASEAEDIGKSVGGNGHGAARAAEGIHLVRLQILEVAPVLGGFRYVPHVNGSSLK